MCTNERQSYATVRRQHGVTLVELILFIVIVSVAIVGILSVMNITTRASADPMVRKQAVAIAESLMEEITLQPFTYCFPTDANATAATSAADCTAGMSEDTLPAASRVNAAGARDANNVADYNNFNMAPIRDVTGFAPALLADYSATVAMNQVGNTFGVANTDVLQINVTVMGRGENITLTGYRFRYAPRGVP